MFPIPIPIPKDLNSRRVLHNIVDPGSSLAPTECSYHAHLAVDSCSAPPGRSSGKFSYCVYCGAMERAQAKTQTNRGAMDLFRICRLCVPTVRSLAPDETPVAAYFDSFKSGTRFGQLKKGRAAPIPDPRAQLQSKSRTRPRDKAPGISCLVSELFVSIGELQAGEP